MTRILQPGDIPKLGTILSIWAHPDDETYLAGGVLSAAIDNGQMVVCVTATKGEAGSQDSSRWPSERLGKIREAELEQALKILGIKHHYYLGCIDGCCCDAPHPKILTQLRRLIKRYEPDTVLTFGPDGWSGHPDHKQASEWVREAAARHGRSVTVHHVINPKQQYEQYLRHIDKKLNFFFNIDKPLLAEPDACSIYFQLSPELVARKCQALRAMHSQYDKLFKAFPEDFICGAIGCEAFVRAR